MGLHRVPGDEQPICDLLVTQVGRQEPQHPQLSLGQRRRRWELGCQDLMRDVVDLSKRHHGVDPRHEQRPGLVEQRLGPNGITEMDSSPRQRDADLDVQQARDRSRCSYNSRSRR